MGTKCYGSGYGDWVVTKPSHWIYEKTGMSAGDAIPGLIGWEYHGTPASLPGLEVVAEAPLFPVRGWDGDRISAARENPQRHTAVVFPGPKGNWVFNAGTIWWPEGLSRPPGDIPVRHNTTGTFGPDERVEQITRNVLDRFIRESKIALLLLLCLFLGTVSRAEKLYEVPAGVETRWISFENQTGAKGEGGKAADGRKGSFFKPIRAAKD